jgi:hypothetical protein
MKRNLLTVLAVAGAVLLSPLALFAQGQPPNLTNITQFVSALGGIVATLLPILIIVALLIFFWGLIKYIWSANDPAKASEGKSIMIYGVIALFIMVSIWGVVGFLGTALGIDQGTVLTDTPGVNRSPR